VTMPTVVCDERSSRSAPRLLQVGLSALVVLELLDWLGRWRRRTSRTVSVWWSEMESVDRRAVRRAELGSLAQVAGLVRRARGR
jgi:hypothetical protein